MAGGSKSLLNNLGTVMNKIISNLLAEFKTAQKIDAQTLESIAFEHFSAYLTISSLAENTANVVHTLIGGGNQPSVDAIGIIINGTLIENPDEIETFISANNYLDVDFIFIQSKTSQSFESTVLADLADFADSFIELDSVEADTQAVKDIREMKNYIYGNSKFFKRRNPNVYLYYVTTGIKPHNDSVFNNKETKIKNTFGTNGSTKNCYINLIGSKEIQELKRYIDNSIERQIEFSRKIALPPTPGVDHAYIGVVTASSFISLLKGQGDNLLSTIFYDNVRDWQGDNSVNSAIKKTLLNEKSKSRFVFMNNGVTIIAKKIRLTGDILNLEDYQIVNGCQTSNVLWNNKSDLDDSILVPIRLIATTDEKVILDIIKATNSQTEIAPAQLLAATDFQKQLESYFAAQTSIPLYYERRSRQYTNTNVDRSCVLTPINLMKAYASIIIEEPHRTTRDFQSIVKMAGSTIFGAKHKIELYYMSALAQYWVDHFLRKGLIDRSLTMARFQILLAFKLLNQPEGMPPVESNKAQRWASHLIDKLGNYDLAYQNIKPACDLVVSLLADKKNENKRDAARGNAFTQDLIQAVKNSRLNVKK
jgi:AIPR protein